MYRPPCGREIESKKGFVGKLKDLDVKRMGKRYFKEKAARRQV